MALLGVERLEGRDLMSVSVSGGFAGLAFNPSQGLTPPDTQVAVGPTAVGEAVNTTLIFFNRSGGTLFQGDFATLFAPVRVDANDSTLMSDPSLHYDADAGRFVVTILDLDTTRNQAYLDFAVSTTNHPSRSSDFVARQINVTERAPAGSPNAGSSLWTDFDRYGANANAWVFTFNMFTFPLSNGSLFDHAQVLAVQKSAFLGSPASLVTHTLDLPGWNGSQIVNENVAPADMHGASATDPMYFVEEASYGSATNTQLRVLKVPDILNASASNVQSFDVTVPAYTTNPVPDGAHPWNSGDSNANAPQLGSSDQMLTNDTRVLSAAWRRDSQGVEHLVCSQIVGATLARARWYEFVTSSASPTLRQSGDVGAPGASTYFPSIDIAPNGNIGMDYLESSSGEYVSMYATGRSPTDPLNTMQVPALAQAGLTSYTLSFLEASPHRAGDFSGLAVDVDSSGNPLNTFWAANEYTGSNGDWATWITGLSVTPLPQAPAIQVLDGGTVVPDGTGNVSLGATFLGTAVTRTITVKNVGTQPLVLSDPIQLPSGFSLAADFGSTTVAPGASTSFTVRLDATSLGTYSGTVSFGTNDPNNNPFTFTVSGTVSAVSIIDDGSGPGFSTVGAWQLWTNSGYLGNVHEATAKSGADVATWAFPNLLPGQYRVSATWAAWPDRATNAPYTLLDGGTSLGTVPVNQQAAPSGFSDAGGTWQDLGAFQVRSGTLVVQLSDAANGYVIADAVRLQWLGPLPQGPVVQVLDGTTAVPDGTGSVGFGTTFVGAALTRTFTIKNLGTQAVVLSGPINVPPGFSVAAGFGTTTVAPGASTTFALRLDAAAPGSYTGQVSFGTNDPANNPFTFSVSGAVSAVSIVDDGSPAGFSTAGSWQVWTNSGYLGNVHEATAKTGADVASWTFANLLPGQYRVSATWAAWPDRATNAPYTVSDGGTSLGTVPVNQQAAPSGFSDAGGTWQDLGAFQVRSGSLVVQLSDAANGFVIADAVRLQWVAPLPQGPVVQVFDGATAVPDGSGSVGFGTTFVGGTVTKTFTVKNLGTQSVVLSGPINVPSGFSVAADFGATTVAPGASTTFAVCLDATAAGSYGGTVSFGTNDPNNNPFTFSVSGAVSAAGIIDDSSPTGFSTVGGWQLWTNSGYLGNLHEATAKTGADVASWTFANLAPGQYRVSATWAAWPDRATNAPYTVLDGNTSLGTVLVNQQIPPSGFSDAGGAWQDLGAFQVRNGSLVVRLSDAANGYVIADAIRIEWVGSLPLGPAVLSSVATVPVSDGKGSVSLANTFAGFSLTKRFNSDDLGALIPAPGGVPDQPSQQPAVSHSPGNDGALAAPTVFYLPRQAANRRALDSDQSATQSDGLAGA